MRALRYSTRPLSRREILKNGFSDKTKPLVESKHNEITVQEPTHRHKVEFKQHKVRTRFNSRALWRHNYARCRKAKTTAERAISGDWRVHGLNKTPIILRSEVAGIAIISIHQEGRLETAEKKAKRFAAGEIAEGNHTRGRHLHNSATRPIQIESELGEQIVNVSDRHLDGTRSGYFGDIRYRNSQVGNTPNTTMKLIPAEIEATEAEGLQIVTTGQIHTTVTGNTTAITVTNQNTGISQWQFSINPTNQTASQPLEHGREETEMQLLPEGNQNTNGTRTSTFPGSRQEGTTAHTHNQHRLGFVIGVIRVGLNSSAIENNAHVTNAEISPNSSATRTNDVRRPNERGFRRGSKYVQTYSRRRTARLRVVQASITPPEL